VAVRVRKIARELDRSPEDLLRLLKDLGYARFRSEDDMMPDPVAEQLRRAARTHPPRAVLPVPSRPPRMATPSGSPGPVGPSGAGVMGDDLMAKLVPGVVRVEGEAKPRGRPSMPPASPVSKEARPVRELRPPPEPPGRSTELLAQLEGERERLAQERARLEALQERLAAEEQALQVRKAELEAQALALKEAAEREAQAQQALQAQQAQQTPKLALSRGAVLGNSVLALMEERGLRGQDEAERAIAALAGSHALGKLLGTLVPGDPVAFTRLLQERLVLVGGPIPEGLGVPAITVSPERADLPGGERLGRTVGRIGELLLLNGHRRVLLVSVPPRWHTLLRDGMDRRVELLFRATAPARDGREGEELGRVDVVVVWNADLDPGLSPARGGVMSITAPTVGEFLERWCLALTQATVDGP
jgi:hypothetical protein